MITPISTRGGRRYQQFRSTSLGRCDTINVRGTSDFVAVIVLPSRIGGRGRFRMRSEDELKAPPINAPVPKGFILNRRITSQKPERYDLAVVYSEFRKKVDNR